MLARAKQYCIMLGPPYSFLSICATPQASISSNVSNDARMSDGKYPSHMYKVRMVPGEGRISSLVHSRTPLALEISTFNSSPMIVCAVIVTICSP